MKIDGVEAKTVADGVSVSGGYDLGLFHKPNAETITGLLGDGIEFVGRFELKMGAVTKMANALGVVTTAGMAPADAVEALAVRLAYAGTQKTWEELPESDGSYLDHGGRGYWRRLASVALQVPFKGS